MQALKNKAFFENLNHIGVGDYPPFAFCISKAVTQSARDREESPIPLMTALETTGSSSTTLPQSIIMDAIEDFAFGSRFLCGHLHLIVREMMGQ